MGGLVARDNGAASMEMQKINCNWWFAVCIYQMCVCADSVVKMFGKLCDKYGAAVMHDKDTNATQWQTERG